MPSLSVSSEPSRPPTGPTGRTRSLADSAGPGQPVTPPPLPLLVQRSVPGPCFSCLALCCWPSEPSDRSAVPRKTAPLRPGPGGHPTPALRARDKTLPLSSIGAQGPEVSPETGTNPGSPQMVCGRQSPCRGLSAFHPAAVERRRPADGPGDRSAVATHALGPVTSDCHCPATSAGRQSAAIQKGTSLQEKLRPWRDSRGGDTAGPGRRFAGFPLS